MISDSVRSWLRDRIAENPTPQGASDWPRALARDQKALLIDGDNVTLWFLSEDGTLWSADRDAVVPRLVEADAPTVVAQVLGRAQAVFPVLGELLRPQPLAPGGGRELTSPDGRWRATVVDDLDGVGAEVTVLRLFAAGTGDRVRLLELSFAGLRLVRFLAPQRLLLADERGECFFEVDFDAPRPRRQVLPGFVVEPYRDGP